MPYELVQQLVTGRGIDLGWSRVLHFQRGVVFRNPVFDFNIKLSCLHEDLFCFRVRRNIGESIIRVQVSCLTAFPTSKTLGKTQL